MTAIFERVSDGAFRVRGELTFATVRDLLSASMPEVSGKGRCDVDLSAVTAADSAGLALLIEWFRHAEATNTKLRLVSPPAQLRALAKISDVESILPFADG